VSEFEKLFPPVVTDRATIRVMQLHVVGRLALAILYPEGI
jgi:hypothetical protein